MTIETRAIPIGNQAWALRVQTGKVYTGFMSAGGVAGEGVATSRYTPGDGGGDVVTGTFHLQGGTLEMTVELKREVIEEWTDQLKGLRGTEVTGVGRWLDFNRRPIGSTITRRGILQNVSEPDYESGNPDVGILTVAVEFDGESS